MILQHLNKNNHIQALIVIHNSDILGDYRGTQCESCYTKFFTSVAINEVGDCLLILVDFHCKSLNRTL